MIWSIEKKCYCDTKLLDIQIQGLYSMLLTTVSWLSPTQSPKVEHFSKSTCQCMYLDLIIKCIVCFEMAIERLYFMKKL